jgi:hypothetical protein
VESIYKNITFVGDCCSGGEEKMVNTKVNRGNIIDSKYAHSELNINTFSLNNNNSAYYYDLPAPENKKIVFHYLNIENIENNSVSLIKHS